jgi:hypothetical protein
MERKSCSSNFSEPQAEYMLVEEEEGDNFMEVKFEKAPDDVLPKCPFCKHRLDKVWVKLKGLGILAQKQIIICPACESFLGFGSVIR